MFFIFNLFQLQKLAVQLSDLWNLMDTPMEEHSLFDYVSCNISSTVDEVTIPGALALDLIEQVERNILLSLKILDSQKATLVKQKSSSCLFLERTNTIMYSF